MNELVIAKNVTKIDNFEKSLSGNLSNKKAVYKTVAVSGDRKRQSCNLFTLFGLEPPEKLSRTIKNKFDQTNMRLKEATKIK